MNELTNEKTMTIKEISEKLDCSEITVRRKIKEKYPLKIQNGKITKLNESECYDVIGEIKTEINKQIRPRQNVDLVKRSELKEFAKEIVSETLKQIIPLLQNNNTKQIELKQDYYSITAYANINNISISFSDALKLGKEAGKISRANDIEIRKIPDERWGKINSYSIKVLEKVFEI